MTSTCKVVVGEATLEWATCGAGDTVVLLPAGAYNLNYLAAFAQRLAEAGFRAVAVNWRGIGASTGPLEGLTLHHLAADIAGVVETLAAAPAHVVGHAFGNRVARCLAADRPDLVRSVVLLAAGGLVAADPEAGRVAQRLRHDPLTASERLELSKAIYLSPASDPRLLLQVQQSPAWTAAHVVAQVSQATPSTTGGQGGAHHSWWSRDWMTGRPHPAMAGHCATTSAHGCA